MPILNNTRKAPSLRIAVIEDNDEVREATVDFLSANGHRVNGFFCAEDLTNMPEYAFPDLAIVDVNLPGESGFNLARRLRSTHPNLGLVVMSARSASDDKIEGYLAGVDHYLVKPVPPSELLLCINNLARRIKPQNDNDGIALNTRYRSIEGSKGVVQLTEAECALLAGFVRAPGGQLERWQAIEILDPEQKGISNINLDVRISALRKKIMLVGSASGGIRTLRGVGYCLDAEVKIF